jgi:hypothetical protein
MARSKPAKPILGQSVVSGYGVNQNTVFGFGVNQRKLKVSDTATP